MKFIKYHGLGNDYLVIEPGELHNSLTPEQIRTICDRHYGVGSDGILLGPIVSSQADFSVRIFNPDGSEAEKSGNGLRIFSRYLWDTGRLIREKLDGFSKASIPFIISTLGGEVTSQVLDDGKVVRIEMGKVSFDSNLIPVKGSPRDVLDEKMVIENREVRYSAATLGNPHCVVLCQNVSSEVAKHMGPLIENNPLFPNRTNVQFMEILNRANIRIEIWERGAGYTLASGSSSCAAAAVAHRLGYCDDLVLVHMPGGQLEVKIRPDYTVVLTGPVEKVFEGKMDL